MNQLQRRQAREAQARHRGSRASYVTAMENALLILAWEAAELSEGQVSAMLDMDRVSLRKLREDLIDRGMAVAQSLSREPSNE